MAAVNNQVIFFVLKGSVIPFKFPCFFLSHLFSTITTTPRKNRVNFLLTDTNL